MNLILGDARGGLNPAKETAFAASRFERSLAAIQASILAAAVSLGWWMLSGLATNQSIWTLPNLMGGAVFGARSLRASPGIYTATGLSFHILLCLGFALIASQILPTTLRLTTSILASTLGASIWFYLWDGFFWHTAFPPFALYSKQPTIFLGFLLQGLCIGLYSILVRSTRAIKIST